MENEKSTTKGISEKGVAWILFAAYCVLLFIVYAKYYFADCLPLSGDAINWITDITLLKNALANGEFPFWNKFLIGGIPFAPSFTPIMLLGFLPIKEMVYVLYISIVAIGAVCAFLYFRMIGCTRWAAGAISTCYLLSIHLGGARKSHTFLIFTMALLPVLLYLIERYFKTRKLRWLMTSSVVMAVQFCIGFLQQVVYTDLFLGLYLIAFGFHYRMKISIMLRHGLAWVGAYFGLIAWKLFPMLEQTAVYTNAGAVNATEDVFKSYSIHIAKLIQTIFPNFFGTDNVNQAMGPYVSSEMDIELFLGHMIVLLVIAGAVLLVKNFRVRFALVGMIFTYAYAASGTIPVLSKIIYRVPLLNGFRAPARILFVFLFCALTIAAIALSELRNEAFCKKVLKVGLVFFGGIVVIAGTAVLAATIQIGALQGFIAEAMEALAAYCKESLVKDCVVMVLCVVLLALVLLLAKKRPKWVHVAICIAVTGVTLFETVPYTAKTEPYSLSVLQASDRASEVLKTDLGNYKVWDAFYGIDGVHASPISLNRATSKEIPALNAYITFNNPRLYRLLMQSGTAPLNSSGLLTGSMKADQNLHLQNSLLSMLGVKYIIDSSGLLAQDSSAYRLSDQRELIVQKDSISLPYLDGDVSYYFETLALEPNTCYEVSVSCYVSAEQSFYVDFYAGLEYDSPEQEVSFNLQPGENHLTGLIFSGTFDSSALTDIYWRTVSLAVEDLELRDFTISKIFTEKEENVYQLFSTEGDVPIYLNTKARDVLYVPDRIERIENDERLYQNACIYQFDKVSYSETLDSRELDPSATVISVIDFGYNRITAQISAEEGTFVNFSQAHYPGWHVYVNGEETQLHMINGLIMGAEIPAGSSTLEFVYKPITLAAGVTISLLAEVVLIGGLLVGKKKKHMPSKARGSDLIGK